MTIIVISYNRFVLFIAKTKQSRSQIFFTSPNIFRLGLFNHFFFHFVNNTFLFNSRKYITRLETSFNKNVECSLSFSTTVDYNNILFSANNNYFILNGSVVRCIRTKYLLKEDKNNTQRCKITF